MVKLTYFLFLRCSSVELRPHCSIMYESFSFFLQLSMSSACNVSRKYLTNICFKISEVVDIA